MKRKHLSHAIGCVLLSAMMTPMVALAQDAGQEQDDGQDEVATLNSVTVTARRKVETIQEVPVAVSAFGEEQLAGLQQRAVRGSGAGFRP